MSHLSGGGARQSRRTLKTLPVLLRRRMPTGCRQKCPRMATRTRRSALAVLRENNDIARRVGEADFPRTVERRASRHDQPLAFQLALHLREIAYLDVER